MDLLNALILGIIEGLTEFLPISSTGHLIVVSQWLNIEQTDNHKAFEVIIQLAAILAVITHYKSKFTLQHISLWTKVAVSFIPIGALGFLFHEQIKQLFTVEIVAAMFIIGGIVFLILENFYKESKHKTVDIEQVSFLQALLIGVTQTLALIPGTSRAGASIVGGLLVGLNRKAATEWSFLLALPVLAAAAGFDLLKHYNDLMNEDLMALGVGFVVSFIVAFLVIKLFLSFLQRFTFRAFGIYRIAFGALLIHLLG